jgi:hypothetical protein
MIEKDWLAFGHRFADRCGFGEQKDQAVPPKNSKEPKIR